MKWTYIVRNRERWADVEASARNQAGRARDLLQNFGIGPEAIETIAKEKIVEVRIPFHRENEQWEWRIFPWEYVIASATRAARRGQALTVTRHLEMEIRPAAPRAPERVLYVESAPGNLPSLYDFDTERELVRTNTLPRAPASGTQNDRWRELRTPTPEALEQAIADFQPDIVHLAGFDSHQGLRLLAENARGPATYDTEGEDGPVPDGYLLAQPGGRPRVVSAQELARLLCGGRKKPLLVSFSLQNSAARLGPLVVAAGAGAALSFQDAVDDELVELFFGTFYRAWRKGEWQLLEAFRHAWETVRAQPSGLLGTGFVLWSGNPLVQEAARPGAPRARVAPERQRPAAPPEARQIWTPGAVPESDAGQVVRARIKPVAELNYALLHNRQPLFEEFTLLNGSAEYQQSDTLKTLADVDVRVRLSAGTETASFERRLAIDSISLPLRDKIHVPLTSDLLRSVHETINTSLFVEVAWGEQAVYRDSHLIRLLPVDQWRDNDKDGQWLPSFVLPRDPAVGDLIEKAQHYVRVLRDDPSAGFDGYQSLDPNATEPWFDVDRQVQAIWSTIVHELDLGYINPPPTYTSEFDSQRLRTPTCVVRDRVGTCIDLALLMAACLELVDIYPVIFLLDSHAFPGYWRDAQFHDAFFQVTDGIGDDIRTETADKTVVPGAQPVPWWPRKSAYPEIVKQVKLGNLVPMETVWLTEHSGFWAAVEGGRDNLKTKSGFHSLLDIARAREAQVTPLPIGGDQ